MLSSANDVRNVVAAYTADSASDSTSLRSMTSQPCLRFMERDWLR